MRVLVDATSLYTYPDLTVVCGKPEFLDGQFDTLKNPTVIVEILSGSTESYDRDQKFEHYRALPSLREYVLVSQHTPMIERYARRDGSWVMDVWRGLDAVMRIESLDCEVSLREVYRNVLEDDPASPGPTHAEDRDDPLGGGGAI